LGAAQALGQGPGRARPADTKRKFAETKICATPPEQSTRNGK
jgi:hypothetical protein